MSQPATPAAPAATPAAPAVETPQTAPQPTPPATPAEPATPVTPPEAVTPPAPAPEEIGAPPVADTGITYQPTGDAGLDIALGFIGKLGLGPDHDAVVAAKDGNFDRLEATLAAMGDDAKGYEPYVTLAKEAFERNKTSTEANQTAITQAVTEVAGDAQTWAAVKDWAGKNATPEEKAAINAMLQAGPVQARAAAQMLTNLYRNAGGTVVTPQSATNTNAGNPASTSNGALSPAEYTSAVRELRGRLGSRMEGSPEYFALIARRKAWRG